jgi:hypothetical protein
VHRPHLGVSVVDYLDVDNLSVDNLGVDAKTVWTPVSARSRRLRLGVKQR